MFYIVKIIVDRWRSKSKGVTHTASSKDDEHMLDELKKFDSKR